MLIQGLLCWEGWRGSPSKIDRHCFVCFLSWHIYWNLSNSPKPMSQLGFQWGIHGYTNSSQWINGSGLPRRRSECTHLWHVSLQSTNSLQWTMTHIWMVYQSEMRVFNCLSTKRGYIRICLCCCNSSSRQEPSDLQHHSPWQSWIAIAVPIRPIYDPLRGNPTEISPVSSSFFFFPPVVTISP